MTDKAILTCALTGVLTDPAQHPVPVTTAEMAAEARAAFDAGASIVHVHLRQQEPGRGHLASWDPAVAAEVCDAIRAACPGIVVNLTTGIVGPDISGPAACIRRVRPEIAACNAGTLNYLKIRDNGQWAWPPMVFDNPVEKVARFLELMRETGTRPEFECFDVGIVRSVAMYRRAGLFDGTPELNFVMGVASGMLRTGLEDTFYLPDGSRARGNGELVQALARCARDAGRDIASPAEARTRLELAAAVQSSP